MQTFNETVTGVLETSSSSDDSTGGIPDYLGYVSCVIAILFFGSNFVPVKKFETGDGIFFQWVCCAAIWFTGLCVHLFRYPHGTFYPLAMLGGVLWCTGNVLTVPIIKTIGLGQGILVWGSFNLLTGWASGRFGWFGLDAEVPSHLTLNYLGVSFCMVSAVVYIFLKTDVGQDKPETLAQDNGTDPLLQEATLADSENHVNEGSPHVEIRDNEKTFFDKLSPVKKRILGTGFAMIAGVLYGVNFAPVIYIQNNYQPKPSQNGLDYILAHFCGIFMASTFYLVVYSAFMQNKPKIYPQAILPAIASGLMWGVADAGWFVANSVLSEAVSFPIVTTGPGMIGCLWGLFFKEIRGLRNYLILILAFSLTITGAVLTGVSK